MRLVALWLVMCFGAHAQADPEKLIYRAGEGYELVESAASEHAGLSHGDTIPVYTETDDGELIEGVVLQVDTSDGNFAAAIPHYLMLKPDGTYEMVYARWSVDERFPSGPHFLSGSESITVWSREIAREARELNRERRRRERAEYEEEQGEYRTPSIIRNAILLMLGR